MKSNTDTKIIFYIYKCFHVDLNPIVVKLSVRRKQMFRI